ncbi:tight adherence protein C [Hasllibacter halocynthiae]|uniref:Tight adherence protein C n=1 Tax=Hasllibacter halocynthiae TaxID=595589 RepID=A0A2T0X9L4_9RHOB|nr:type II secretion system F family protein [Hasllibacter halocynthiae]PRY95626.1 tight adherence protein C [Hasllibacter halocynthiae]
MQPLIDALGPDGALYVLGGTGILLVLGALVAFLKPGADPYRRLDRKGAIATGGAPAAAEAGRLRESGEKKLEKFSGFLEPQSEEELTEIKRKLQQAGYTNRDAVSLFYLSQAVLGIGMMALGGFYVWMNLGAEPPMSTTTMVLAILGPGVGGYYMPKRYIASRAKAREEEIVSGFPDSLDLMLVCIEAGQSMDQSIIRVANELQISYPALAAEFELVAYEMKAGKDKAQVFRDMADRCGVQDITSFTTVLIQSQTFGTSIADALRVYAAEMRDKRVMRAEEKANKLPTKMTLATMMLTLPPLLIILLSPSILEIMAVLSGDSSSTTF